MEWIGVQNFVPNLVGRSTIGPCALAEHSPTQEITCLVRGSIISKSHSSIDNGEGAAQYSVLGPIDGVNVDTLLYHLPEGTGKKRSTRRHSKASANTHLMSRNFWTVAISFSMTKSTSASVVNRPNPNRKEEWAISSAAPRARRTYDGSSDADVQALPEERAISFNAMRRLSPSTYAKLRLTQPGYPLRSPFRTTWSILDPSPSIRRWANL